MVNLARAQNSDRSPYVLYQGDILSQDVYSDIDRGYTHFFQSHLDVPIKDFKNYDFSITLNPRNYYIMPTVEFLNHYLTKYRRKSLSAMSLTALHEAISNSLLWGLLKVKRPNDWLEFGQVIEKKLAEIEPTKQTLSVAITDTTETTIHIINPHDHMFDMNAFKADDERFPRGFELMDMFSTIHYDSDQKILSLTFNGDKDVVQTIP